MAQALEKVNESQNLRKMFSFAIKMVTVLQICFWRNPVFSKVIDQ